MKQLVVRNVLSLLAMATMLMSCCAGCGDGGVSKGPVGDVSGEVTLAGKPVEKGMVVMTLTTPPANGIAPKPVLMPFSNGKYTMPEVPVGSYQVTITPNMNEMTAPDIPTKYTVANTSGFTAEVKAGVPNTLNFDMKP